MALAVWRISSLLAHESGPFEIFDKLRNRLGVCYNERSEPYGTNTLARGILCIWCNSVWVSVLETVMYLLLPRLTILLSLPLALSALAIGWHELIEKKQR